MANQTFTITLPEHVIEALNEGAAQHGTTPGKYAAAFLEQASQPIKWVLPAEPVPLSEVTDKRLMLIPDHSNDAAGAYERGWREGLLKMHENISGRYTLFDVVGEAWQQYRMLLKRDAELGPESNPFASHD